MASGYFKIPDEVIGTFGAKIGAYGLAVLTVIARHLDSEGRCSLSQVEIGRKIGATRYGVMDAIKKLCEVGLLKTEGKKGENSTYLIGWQWDRETGKCVRLTFDGVWSKTTCDLKPHVDENHMLIKTTTPCDLKPQVNLPPVPPLTSPDPISLPPTPQNTGNREGEKKKAALRPDPTDECAKSLLAAFRLVRYPTEKHFTESDWQAYRSNLRTLVKDGFTPEQVTAATQNALSRWNREMVNPRSMARHITALLEPETRGSPVAARNGHSSHDRSLWETAEAIGRDFEDL